MTFRRLSMTVVVITIVSSVVAIGGIFGQGRGIPESIAFFSARTGNNEIFVMILMAADRSGSRTILHPTWIQRSHPTVVTSFSHPLAVETMTFSSRKAAAVPQ